MDGKFGFGLDLDNFVKLGLKVEQELSDKEIAGIVKEAEFQKILEKLLRFAMLRPRSEKEIWGWMKRHEVHESIYNDLFSKLKHLELVGDHKFVSWWIEQRLSFNHKSKKELVWELKKKGIDDSLIKETIEKFNIDEIKIARDLIRKKIYRWETLERNARLKKMSEFLARRGFGWDTIRSAIDDSGEKI